MNTENAPEILEREPSILHPCKITQTFSLDLPRDENEG